MCVYLRVTCDWFLNGSTKLTTHIGPVLLMKDWTYVCTQHIEQSSSFALCVVCTKLTHEVQPKQTGPSQNKQGPSQNGWTSFASWAKTQAKHMKQSLACDLACENTGKQSKALLRVFCEVFGAVAVFFAVFLNFHS